MLAHLVARLLGEPLPLAMLAAAQLGVPVAAATIGSQLDLLEPGEGSALVLGALLTLAVAVLGGSLAVRAGLVEPPSPAMDDLSIEQAGRPPGEVSGPQVSGGYAATPSGVSISAISSFLTLRRVQISAEAVQHHDRADQEGVGRAVRERREVRLLVQGGLVDPVQPVTEPLERGADGADVAGV